MSDRSNPWAARSDVMQGLSGLLLVLFVWAHMFFESSILLGKDAMLWVTHMFEGVHVFGEPYPQLVSAVALVVFLLLALHAGLALRRLPARAREYRAIHTHLRSIHHADTTVWYVQVVTGFALFFLASAHLIQVMLQPDAIGPYASSDRIWSGRFWILYALLLITVHVHAGAGFYRLVMKWGPLTAANAAALRRRTRTLAIFIVGFFLLLGGASLATYMKIGYEHRALVGERYVPGSHADLNGGE